MKKTIIILTMVIVFTCLTAFIQCDTLLFFKEGTKTTMTSYDGDGKLTNTVKTTYIKLNNTDSGTVITANQELYDKKDKLTSTNDFNIRCQKGTLYFDMKMMMPQQSAAFKDMEMTIDGADMEMPSSLTVGSTLKDANMTFHFKPKGSSPVPAMNFEVNVHNRKVEAKESITTTAGTFQCYKITEDIETKSLFHMTMKSVQWFSSEAGTVKTESYKENGKLVGHSELTELKK